MYDELKVAIESAIAPIIDKMEIELVELNLRKRDKIVVVDVIADKVGGGITIDECTQVNKAIVRLIEDQQWFGDDFVVEVASPGLDRELKTEKDFTRARGRKVRVHLFKPIEGKVEHHGQIAQVDKNNVQINDKNQMITIPLETISKAVQIIE